MSDQGRIFAANWPRVRHLTDANIRQAIASDPDAAPTGVEF